MIRIRFTFRSIFSQWKPFISKDRSFTFLSPFLRYLSQVTIAHHVNSYILSLFLSNFHHSFIRSHMSSLEKIIKKNFFLFFHASRKFHDKLDIFFLKILRTIGYRRKIISNLLAPIFERAFVVWGISCRSIFLVCTRCWEIQEIFKIRNIR